MIKVEYKIGNMLRLKVWERRNEQGENSMWWRMGCVYQVLNVSASNRIRKGWKASHLKCLHSKASENLQTGRIVYFQDMLSTSPHIKPMFIWTWPCEDSIAMGFVSEKQCGAGWWLCRFRYGGFQRKQASLGSALNLNCFLFVSFTHVSLLPCWTVTEKLSFPQKCNN